MTIRNLFIAYSNMDTKLLKEILDLKIGDKKYDKNYMVIKDFFKNSLTKTN